MSRRTRLATMTLVAVMGAATFSGTSQGANVIINGWGTITADLGGGALVWSDTAPAVTNTFTYWRTYTGRASVRGTRIGTVDKPVIVRTSAGLPKGARVRATGTARGFVTIAPGTTFAGPVIWCCDTSATEVVVSSDGRGTAPHPAGAGLDGSRVRWIAGGPGGGIIGGANPIENDLGATSAPIAGSPGPGLASIATGVAAWVGADASSVWIGVPADDGVHDARQVPQGGRITSVFATPSFVVTTVRSGSRSTVVRTAVVAGSPRVVWRGTGTPVVAAGGDAIAIGVGTKVLSSRGSSKAKVVGTAKGTVAAVATDGTRVAVFERVTRRVTVKKRTKTVKTTTGRIIGRVR